MTADKLAYEVHSGSGPYLLLLHGVLCSSAQWRLNLTELGKVCKPVTVELWGHGESPSPEDPDKYLPESYVQELERIRLEIGADKWFLCGFSLGAGITVRYVHSYPDSVLAHIVTNSSSAFADEALRKQWLADAAATREKFLKGGKEAILDIPVHPRFSKRMPQDLREALVREAEKLTPVAAANTLGVSTPNAGVRNLVPDNPKPALLCFGKLEKRFHAYKEWLSNNMPDLDIAELDAAHCVNMEDVEGFNQAVTGFISRHTPQVETTAARAR